MIRKIIFFLLLFFISLDICSETDSTTIKRAYKYTVDVYKISDKTFYQVINKVLKRDKKQSYYNPTISYLIQFNKPDSVGGIVFGFEGNTNKRQHLEFDRLKGCFRYKCHDFFICFDSIPSSILYKTNKSKVFRSSEPYIIMEDDSWEKYIWEFLDYDYTLYRTH